MTKALKLDKHGKLALSEADVTKQCVDWLRAEGWICIRRHVGTFTAASGNKVTIGQKGDPDWLVMKQRDGKTHAGCYEVFHLELKTKGGRLRKDQKVRHSQLRMDGETVLVCRDLEQLRRWV